MHNVVKHAGASRINLTVTTDESGTTLVVRDNGVGFDPGQDFHGHLGLKSMRERAAKLEGTTDIESAPGSGTAITVRFPVRPGSVS
jgi:signal transduction histidine kinase